MLAGRWYFVANKSVQLLHVLARVNDSGFVWNSKVPSDLVAVDPRRSNCPLEDTTRIVL